MAQTASEFVNSLAAKYVASRLQSFLEESGVLGRNISSDQASNALMSDILSKVVEGWRVGHIKVFSAHNLVIVLAGTIEFAANDLRSVVYTRFVEGMSVSFARITSETRFRVNPDYNRFHASKERSQLVCVAQVRDNALRVDIRGKIPLDQH